MKDLSPPPHHKNLDQKQTQNQTPGLTFNWQDWLPYFEDAGIPDAQKREMIETLWQIVVAFVDLGFDLNPHQQSCGQNVDLKSLLEEAVVKSSAAQNAPKSADGQARSLPNNPKP